MDTARTPERAALDYEALNQIAALLSGECSADTFAQLAEIVRITGRQVRDSAAAESTEGKG